MSSSRSLRVLWAIAQPAPALSPRSSSSSRSSSNICAPSCHASTAAVPASAEGGQAGHPEGRKQGDMKRIHELERAVVWGWREWTGQVHKQASVNSDVGTKSRPPNRSSSCGSRSEANTKEFHTSHAALAERYTASMSPVLSATPSAIGQSAAEAAAHHHL
eukprot:1143328-Pelagomonas_calceolata.AAC.9